MKLAICLLACAVLACGGEIMNFKFPTSGQSVDDALVISQVLHGNSLKTPAPSDPKKFLDAQNNALFQWRRRGRINNTWRDNAGVPVSEEKEQYEIDVYSGSDVVRTATVYADQAQPVQWNKFYRPDLFAISTDGTGSISRYNDFIGDTAAAGSVQLIDGDFVFEFETYHDGSQLYYLPNGIDIMTANDLVGGNSIGSIGSGFISTQSGPIVLTIAAGDKFVIASQQGVTSYYKNPTSDQSPVLYREAVSTLHAPYWIRVSCSTPGVAGFGIRNPSLLRFNSPDWTYTADMQTTDGLTPGAAIHVKIYQISQNVGRGHALDVTL